MRKWEDIVKDKMEEPEGALPESVFAEFRARREAAAAAPAPKRFPLVWAAVPAVAAGLAAVLFLRRPGAPDEEIQIIRQPAAPVAVAADSPDVAETVPETPLVVPAVPPRAARQFAARPQAATGIEIIKPTEEVVLPADPAGTTLPLEEADNAETDVQEPDVETSVESPAGAAVQLFIPEKTHTRAIKLKVGPVVGVLAGGGLLAAAAAVVPFFGARSFADANVIAPDNPVYGENVASVVPSHIFPLRVGLSARIPVSDGLYVSTGIEYALYQSAYKYASLAGEKKQQAHYLGIPVRMDWVLTSGRLFDAYVGAGLEGDVCLGATLAGNKIAKDGFSLSLLGAGGAQMHITRQLGLYVEPELSWQFPAGGNRLATYRSEHPLMFSVVAGLRVNLGKQ